MALGGVLVGVAIGAQQLLVLGGEGLVHQGTAAFEAVETLIMPVAFLVRQILKRERKNDRAFGRKYRCCCQTNVVTVAWTRSTGSGKCTGVANRR